MARNSESKWLLGVGPAAQAPHFVLEACPTMITPALLRLPDDAHVTFESGIKRWHLRGSTTAGQLRDQIAETISRQREGYFTLDEAAQILADSQPSVNPVEAVKRFRLAHQKGHLTIHQGGSRFPREAGESISDFHDLLEARALDEWLRASVGYGFPGGAPAGEPVTPVEPAAPVVSGSTLHSTKGQKRRDDLWPAIEAAQEAAQAERRNPLDTAAVWGNLWNMALTEAMAPLLGTDGRCILWQRADRVASLNRGALHKRLHPEKRR